MGEVIELHPELCPLCSTDDRDTFAQVVSFNWLYPYDGRIGICQEHKVAWDTTTGKYERWNTEDECKQIVKRAEREFIERVREHAKGAK